MKPIWAATLSMIFLAFSSVVAQETAAPDPAAVTAEAAAAPEPTGPDEVAVGVYINDIQQLDLQTHSYAMDFYIWLRWTNSDIDPSLTLE